MSTHIGANPGDIAKGILLPGDPLRAKYIAENFLENPVCFNNVRGMLGFTGTYKGKRISAMGTGMGIPSISIYVNELMRDYGVENLIRIGTCGSMRPEIKMKDVIIAQGACTDNDFNHHVFSGTYAPIADFDLLRTAYKKAGELGIKAWVGNVISGDMFYGEDIVANNPIWENYGVLAGEMEAAALLTLAKKYKARALAMVTVSDSPYDREHAMTPKDREQSLNNMITVALETVAEFV
ncbi:MAG: purine-nucleoside phosphorylase [Oscillospiraceae bacterium]